MSLYQISRALDIKATVATPQLNIRRPPEDVGVLITSPPAIDFDESAMFCPALLPLEAHHIRFNIPGKLVVDI